MLQGLTITWDPDALRAFDSSTSDILILEKPTALSFTTHVGNAHFGVSRSPMTSCKASVFIGRCLAKLNIDNSGVQEDMVATFRTFLAQYRLDEANLQVECTDRRNCPAFHCDNVHIRMVKTYFGPTTEYIHVAAPNDICSAPLGSMIFIKGRRHRNHSDSVYHRSPDVPEGSKRLCLIVDF